MSSTPRRGADALDFTDPLDAPAPDDADLGWGGSLPAGADAGKDAEEDLRRFLDEKPPHHL
ncbi:hypothetical protein [Streptomyces sp. 7-21]|jgi:hypothetical protein|uniref:hypothetical protein n=1 Tax=Streptomyces sp. 7-21 TaxID=2802283 RepID=UPI00191CD362|nr:hypothetical protein [Streptomyces sp. 7-21]MBL1067430.1 hypothetical protein [Streptomyces sp. 7-21]